MVKTTLALASALLVLLAASTDASPASSVHVHHSKDAEVAAHQSHHHSDGGKHHQQFKETPWESEPAVKKAKCADFCLLQGFWAHQLGRNCYSRPTTLCMNYKLAAAGLDAVIAVAECSCPTANATTTHH